MASESVSGKRASSVAVSISQDRMSVILNCSYEDVCSPELMEIIFAEFERLKIHADRELAELNQAIAEARDAKTGISNRVIVRGTLPAQSKEGYLEWTHDYFASGYYVDPTTQVADFHRMAAAPSVKAGELIVVVHPPQLGESGADVLGKALPAKSAKAAEIRPGPGVYWDEEVHGYKAEKAGRVRFASNKLEVQESYEVNRNVGAETGNINHFGSVVVRGDVDSEFSIEATGDIVVEGLIAAADIKCDGHVTAKKGIRSTSSKRIIAKGGLQAKYLDCAVVYSEGDVVIESEILDSSVRTTGKVICHGRIQGGDIMAAGGIETKEAGSKLETRTVLFVGVDYRVLFALREANEAAKKLKAEVTTLETDVKRLAMYRSSLSHKQRETLTELEFKLFEAKEKFDNNTESRKTLSTKVHANQDAVVLVIGQINPGVMLRVLDAQLEVRQAFLGPLRAAFDRINRQVAFSSVEHVEKE